jgi:Response regulator containing a CheY-like receiver domain and an HD-GYP domain
MFAKTKKKAAALEKDLFLANLQSKKYALDLAKIYKSTKDQKEELGLANKQLKKYAQDLRKTISTLRMVNKELQDAYYDTIHRLVLAVEYKDKFTGSHIMRMSRYSALLAKKIGLPTHDVLNIFYAAPMHDVGKIGIPDTIISKPSKLTSEEFDIIKKHTVIGAEILDNSKSNILMIARQIALSHHEKWNGGGYPNGLVKNDIPLSARIVALADTFDVLISKRSYKEPYPVSRAIEIIKSEREKHFDPDIADVFEKNLEEIIKVNSALDLNNTSAAILDMLGS